MPSSLPYEQRIDTCFDDKIGKDGLSRAAYEKALGEAEAGVTWLKEAYEKKTLALLAVPERKDDLAAVRDIGAKLLDNTTDLFIFGIGGSSLGAQAIAQLTGWGTQAHIQKGPRVFIVDNLDAQTMQAALSATDLKTTRFLVVSKSGGTVEPAIQMLSAMSAIEKAGGGKYMKHHFAVLTEPSKNGKPNPMRAFAEKHGFATIEHDPGVGGRYAVLTSVGLLPADILGLDIEAFRAGALDVLKPVIDGKPAKDIAPAIGAALSIALQREKGADISVLMAYADRLDRFIAWHCQLWAESLGKDGKGTTPVKAIGPVDQHSQLQLYLAGPKDKMFTVFRQQTAGEGPEVNPVFADDAAFAGLAGKHIGDLVDAEARATIDTLAKNGRPVRTFTIPKLNERTLGALFMHFMLETIIAGKVLGVDPFDQPAVEEGKILAKQYLAEMK
ncbi:MAG: glucose-6-phosphate isomerase [Parvibaculum sp.]|uniref:glucose-6-phosphate isomerase n=1 Tax=Parvibaculum sp. TaxID=2024848 RepID=UPI0025DB3CCC|nr:glucose-6-phosphate isomerase [Parvibaculum sp.]MCE9650995.1 glucose-6-phosphate isomerase [Parvibaculum sp.]